MKVKYDKEVDIIYIKLTDLPIKESDEEKPGIIIDYAENGSIVGLEILNASAKMSQPNVLEHKVA